MISFCVAFSKDKGKTFSEKKTIFSGNGIGNSRMMRAKVLSKKDGSFIAVVSNSAVMLWEQSKGEGTPTQLAYRKIAEGQVSETTWIADATNATNSTGIVLGNQLVVAYEARQTDGKNSLKFSYVSL